MSFNKAFFNTEHPPMRTRIGISWLALAFVGFFVGVWLDFVTSPDWYHPLVLVATPAVALVHGALLWYGAKSEGRLGSMSSAFAEFVLPFCGILMLAALYLPTVTKTVPYLVTRANGEEYRKDLVMVTESGRRKYRCRHRLEGGPLGNAFSTHLCISEATYLQFPDQAVVVSVSGWRGPLGMTIDHIESVQALGPAP